MLSPQKEMTLIQCMRVYDEWRVSPDTVLKEKMEDRSLCIISSTNGEIMLTYAPVCVWNFLLAQLVRKPPATVGDLGLIPRLGRAPGEGKDYPLQYSGLENSMDCIVCGVTKSQT